MFGIHDLSLFIISGLLLNMAPGPDSLLIVSRSAAQGWRSGSAAALGIGSGTLVHVFAAALGLSTILATIGDGIYDCEIHWRGLLALYGVQTFIQQSIAPYP